MFRLKCLPMSSDILPSDRLAVVPPFMLNICTFHWRDHRYHIEPHCNDISPAFQSWHVPAWESPDHWTSERMGVGGWLWGPNNWATQTQLNVLTFLVMTPFAKLVGDTFRLKTKPDLKYHILQNMWYILVLAKLYDMIRRHFSLNFDYNL